MITRKKTYNSIARSFRSKPSLLIYLFFFSKNGRQIKKNGTEARRETSRRIFSQASLKYAYF